MCFKIFWIGVPESTLQDKHQQEPVLLTHAEKVSKGEKLCFKELESLNHQQSKCESWKLTGKYVKVSSHQHWLKGLSFFL